MTPTIRKAPLQSYISSKYLRKYWKTTKPAPPPDTAMPVASGRRLLKKTGITVRQELYVKAKPMPYKKSWKVIKTLLTEIGLLISTFAKRIG